MKIRMIAIAFFCAFSTASAQSSATDAAIEAFNAKKYAEARELLQPLASRDAVAAFYMGRMAAIDNDLDRAITHFEKATELNPRSAEYYDWLGRVYGTRAQTANKLKLPFLARKTKLAWEKGLSLDPNSLDIMEGLSQYYMRAPGFMGGSKAKAREMAGELRKRNAYRGAIVFANICRLDKDNACVEREIRAILAAYPDSSNGYVSLAAFHANAKQFDKAFDVIDERMKQTPNEPDIQYALGRTAALSGQQLDRGAQALRNYIAAAPENATLAGAHFRLGMIHARKGNRDAARKAYLTALQINPDYADARKELAALGS